MNFCDNPRILIFGFSHAAIEIAHALKQTHHSFKIIDNEPNLLQKAHALHLELSLLDYSDEELLMEEGVGNGVEFIFALFEEDAKNVFLTLCAKSIDPQVHIVAITHTKDAIHKIEIAEASTILDPYQISGKKIYKLITQPEVMNVIDATIFGKHSISMEQITITDHSLINQQMIHAIFPMATYNVLLIGIHDKELAKPFIFITEGHNHKLDAGDILVVIGEDDEIERFKKDFLL